MTYWLEHRFADHSSQVETGSFVSPVTNDLMRLNTGQRGIALAVLLCMPQDPDKRDPLGFKLGYSVTKSFVEKAIGKRISPDTYRDTFDILELAGVFEIEREEGRGHILRPGKLLLCEHYVGCNPDTHNPYWLEKNPLENPSTPLEIPSTPLTIPKDTPLNSLDINNLNNPLITLNTRLGDSEKLEPRPVEPEPSTEPSWRDLLPPNWLKWLAIRARLKGDQEPGGMDIGHALVTYEKTGKDLEPGGEWLKGIAKPQPATDN